MRLSFRIVSSSALIVRLIHVYSGNLYGGLEGMLVTIARTAFSGVANEFALCFEGQLADEIRAAGAAVQPLGAVRVSRPWTVWRARRVLRSVIARLDPDAVICHSPWPLAVFGPAVRAAGKPLVFWLHQYLNGRGFDERGAKRCPPDLVIANSHYTAGSVGELFRTVPVEVVYCPYRFDRVEPTAEVRREVRAELDTPADARVILQASRLEPLKGQRLHLTALAELKHRGGWVCWLVGGAQRPAEATYLAELKRLAASLEIAERVRFPGHRRDVPRLLAAADIVCHPNEAPESFGLAFVDALAAGRPVVATRLGGAIEVIDDSCGVLVDPTPEAVAAALAGLLDDPGRCAALGAAGPERAAAMCDPQHNLGQLYSILRDRILR